VENDYRRMLDVAKYYKNDAEYVNGLVSDFSATSEELLASIQDILMAIDGVAIAANEGAGGSSEIASRVSEASIKSNEVQSQVEIVKISPDQLKSQVGKFKI